MKVRASRLVNARGDAIPRSDYLTVGREYTVLSVFVHLGVPVPRAQVLLPTDAGGRTAGLFDLVDFEVTDAAVSRFWSVALSHERLLIQPEAWSHVDFWSDVYGEGAADLREPAQEVFDTTVRDLLAESGQTMTLYRPTGPTELSLVEHSGWRAWPPRLAGQPIFYPVLDEDYARKIARDWNASSAQTNYLGYVTRFEVQAAFLFGRDVHTVGATWAREYWIPAEELEAFNAAIDGPIEVIATYEGGIDRDPVETSPQVSFSDAD